jgi:hypothetical protein
MSESLGISFNRIIMASLGVVLIIVGGAIGFYAATAQGGPSPVVLAPIGVVVVIFGILLAISKGE